MTWIHYEKIRAGEGNIALYATPNPFLLNKVCLNQEIRAQYGVLSIVETPLLKYFFFFLSFFSVNHSLIDMYINCCSILIHCDISSTMHVTILDWCTETPHCAGLPDLH